MVVNAAKHECAAKGECGVLMSKLAATSGTVIVLGATGRLFSTSWPLEEA